MKRAPTHIFGKTGLVVHMIEKNICPYVFEIIFRLIFSTRTSGGVLGQDTFIECSQYFVFHL